MSDELNSIKFINNHKTSSKDFTRLRKLPFVTLFILILRNSVKSLQVMLNEFILQLKVDWTITASAFSQARKKLKHTAFMALNEGFVSLYYREKKDIKRLYGYRIIGGDGSELTLPVTEEIKEAFGSRAIGNHTNKNLGEYSRAIFEAHYDLLNNIVIKTTLAKGNSSEVELAKESLGSFGENDLLVYDRYYAGYPFLAILTDKKKNFLIRCSRGTFAAAQAMFKDDAPVDIITTIHVPTKHSKQIKNYGLPSSINVRLVKVILPTGEPEVLVTSLMDEEKFPANIFADLYRLRWGVETFFSKLKGRLGLENFTGKNVEANKQDFWSTILISNLETIITEDTEEEVNHESSRAKFSKAINKSVSFNAIKNLAFEILSTSNDKDEILTRLTKLFLTNTISVRKDRAMPRYKISDTRSLNFQKRFRKHVF
jgi:hypothetical protein